MSQQTIIEIKIADLIAQVNQMKKDNYRLVQICCSTLPEGLELQYSFDKNFQYTSLKIKLTDNSIEIPSVSGVYWNAFLYENELHDLFGIKIKGIAVDYQGSFYKTTVKTPFNPPKPVEGATS